MRRNGKLAQGALAVDLVCGIMGLIYLITLGVREAGAASSALLQETAAEQAGMPQGALPLLILAGIMAISTLVMVAALPKKK